MRTKIKELNQDLMKRNEELKQFEINKDNVVDKLEFTDAQEEL